MYVNINILDEYLMKNNIRNQESVPICRRQLREFRVNDIITFSEKNVETVE